MGLKRGAIGNTLGEHIENLGNILGTDGTHWELEGNILRTKENKEKKILSPLLPPPAKT
jgi:hypothetical protein